MSETLGVSNRQMSPHNLLCSGMSTTLTLSTTLMGLLPSDKSFYRYNGSLTTPTCDEVVTWTVFSHYVDASADQVTKSYSNLKLQKTKKHLLSRKEF